MCRAWKPARGYHTAIRNTSWWRNNHDGTITAVAVVWPKERPAFDGGEWTENELWTVRLPLDADAVTRKGPWFKPWRHYWLAPGPVYMLRDKPHRVTWWDEDRPERKVLSRGPLPVKLTACIAAEDKRMERRVQYIGYYLGPVRVPRQVYDVWRAAFRIKKES